jgi:hypothetical protein
MLYELREPLARVASDEQYEFGLAGLLRTAEQTRRWMTIASPLPGLVCSRGVGYLVGRVPAVPRSAAASSVTPGAMPAIDEVTASLAPAATAIRPATPQTVITAPMAW